MKERPILFSAPMVRALLAGTKTQTRRAIKAPASVTSFQHFDGVRWDRMQGTQRGDTINCPYGQPGDQLWVRETFRRDLDRLHSRKLIEYAADDQWRDAGQASAFDFPDIGWRPSIHMPRSASRITLEVTGVRIERLQDISEADALAEGVNVHPDHHGKPRTSIYSPVQAYRDLWEQINGPGSWDANPWVWVVEFKHLEAA